MSDEAVQESRVRFWRRGCGLVSIVWLWGVGYGSEEQWGGPWGDCLDLRAKVWPWGLGANPGAASAALEGESGPGGNVVALEATMWC